VRFRKTGSSKKIVFNKNGAGMNKLMLITVFFMVGFTGSAISSPIQIRTNHNTIFSPLFKLSAVSNQSSTTHSIFGNSNAGSLIFAAGSLIKQSNAKELHTMEKITTPEISKNGMLSVQVNLLTIHLNQKYTIKITSFNYSYPGSTSQYNSFRNMYYHNIDKWTVSCIQNATDNKQHDVPEPSIILLLCSGILFVPLLNKMQNKTSKS
jgi:hypothetical protein